MTTPASRFSRIGQSSEPGIAQYDIRLLEASAVVEAEKSSRFLKNIHRITSEA